LTMRSRDSPCYNTPMPETGSDHRPTMVALAALACVAGDIVHEGLGHGVTAWLSGAHRVTISTVALDSDIDTRLIAANGTLANLDCAAILWLVLRRAGRYRPATRYFLVLSLTGNLFSGTGYFLFSGVSNFGDWAVVIRGLEPHWAWQLGLVATGLATYYAAMVLVGAELEPFRERGEQLARIRRLCWTPYFSDGLLAGIGGLLNPGGFFLVLVSALPSTLGANAGLLSLPDLMRWWKRVHHEEPVGPVAPSAAWMAAGAVAGLLFVFVLGRGLTWSR
jgi:hypothetical protein